MNDPSDVVGKVLLQHFMCSAARDGGSRFPNTARVARNAVQVLDQLNMIKGMGAGGNDTASMKSLMNLLESKKEDDDVTPKWANDIVDRITRLEARK